jgi:type IV pilus assembly protein PilE
MLHRGKEMVKTSMLTAKNHEGFTLIELMIAIAVLGILLAIAIPSYFQYIREARRAEAQSDMLQIRLGMEKWRANHNSYSSTLSNAGFTDSNDYYNYDIPTATATAFTIRATAVTGKSQVNDVTGSGTSCTPMTLDQSGAKTHAACWKK